MSTRLSPLSTAFLRIATHHRFDLVTPIGIALLATVGIVFIYSAQLSTRHQQWPMQLVWLTAGALLYLAVSLVDYKVWLKASHWVYAGAIVFLILVLIPGIGQVRGGARRWLDFGFFSFQPSEAAKTAVLLLSASLLARSKLGSVKDSIWTLGKLALAVGLPMALILAQPDLGSALVIPPVVFALLYVSKLSHRFFVACVAGFTLAVGIVAWDMGRYLDFLEERGLSPLQGRNLYEEHTWVPLHDYQRERIGSFIAPDKFDPMGAGWNLRQSLISVGSGGLTGKGWTEGTQAQLGYLPRGIAHNDFIFSVIAEETGFLGSSVILGLYGMILINGVRVAGSARDRFGALLALGATVLFACHVFVNIAMTIGLVPITGIPLPFISYGGTFVLSCSLLQGLIQSVYRYRKDF